MFPAVQTRKISWWGRPQWSHYNKPSNLEYIVEMGNIPPLLFGNHHTHFTLEAPLMQHQEAGLIVFLSLPFQLSWKDGCHTLVSHLPNTLWEKGKSHKLKNLEKSSAQVHKTRNSRLPKVHNYADYCHEILSHNNDSNVAQYKIFCVFWRLAVIFRYVFPVFTFLWRNNHFRP